MNTNNGMMSSGLIVGWKYTEIQNHRNTELQNYRITEKWYFEEL